MSKNDDEFKVEPKRKWWTLKKYVEVPIGHEAFVTPRDKYYIARKSGKRKKEGME